MIPGEHHHKVPYEKLGTGMYVCVCVCVCVCVSFLSPKRLLLTEQIKKCNARTQAVVVC